MLLSDVFTWLVVVYCPSAFCLSLTCCSFCLGKPGGHLLGKSCPPGFPLVLFYFRPSELFVFLFRLVSVSECGIFDCTCIGS